MQRAIRIEPPEKCACGCGIKKVTFFLPVKTVSRAEDDEGNNISYEDRVITEGTILKTSQGNISDYLNITGICSDCFVEHTAILKVRGGEVKGIDKTTIRGITKEEKKAAGLDKS